MIGGYRTIYFLSLDDCRKVEDAVNASYGTTDWRDPMKVDFMDDLLCEQEYGTDCYVNLHIDEEEVEDAREFLHSEYSDERDVRRYRLLKYLRENISSEINHLIVEVSY